MQKTKTSLTLLTLWICFPLGALAQAPRVATPEELVALYPDFNVVHFRIAGHRIGWTQVKPWPHHDGWEVALIERLRGEGEQAPRNYEVAMLERGRTPRVVARWVGLEGHHSPAEETNGPRIVAFDLGAFEIADGDFAIGIQTETGIRAAAQPSRARMLTLLHLEPPVLKPILSVEWPKAGLKLMKRRGEPFRDVVLQIEGSAGAERTYRWHDPDGFQPVEPEPPATPSPPMP